MQRSILSLSTLICIIGLSATTTEARPLQMPPPQPEPPRAQMPPPPHPLFDRDDWLQPRMMRPPSAAEPLRHPPHMGRGCRGDLFTLSVPVGRALEDHLIDTAVAAVHTALDTLIARDPGILTHEMQGVALDRVIPNNNRHWVFGFVDDHGRRIRVEAERACEVVAAMRRAAIITLGGQGVANGGDVLSIGRECDATAYSDWHEVAMTPDPGPVGPFMLPGGLFATPAHPVKVAVIDGPMSQPGLAWSQTQSDHMRHTVGYPHADAMARFIREMAPSVTIEGYQALSDRSTGTPIIAVARAIDVALADGAQVINLSLGWPSEMGRPMELRGQKMVPSDDGELEIEYCETIEDPAGEAVRELLGRATDAGVIVVAAAGNRVGPQPFAGRGILKGYDAHARLFPCLPPEAVTHVIQPAYSEMFFPAAWSQVPTCVDGPAGAIPREVPVGMPIVAVGAYGQHGEPPIGDATIFAPGIGVPLSPIPSALSQRLPAEMTGTSIAAALTSGYLADLLSQGPVLDPVGAVERASVQCAGRQGLFLQRCMSAALPTVTRRAPQLTVAVPRVSPEPNSAQPLVLDKAGAGGLGPQPDIDPCDDECRLMARKIQGRRELRQTTGDLELRMQFAGAANPTITAVKLELRKGSAVTRYPLGADVEKAMEDQLRFGKIALNLTDVPLTVYADPSDPTTAVNDGLESDMSADLVYELEDDLHQKTRRRSRIDLGFLP